MLFEFPVGLHLWNDPAFPGQIHHTLGLARLISLCKNVEGKPAHKDVAGILTQGPVGT